VRVPPHARLRRSRLLERNGSLHSPWEHRMRVLASPDLDAFPPLAAPSVHHSCARGGPVGALTQDFRVIPRLCQMNRPGQRRTNPNRLPGRRHVWGRPYRMPIQAEAPERRPNCIASATHGSSAWQRADCGPGNFGLTASKSTTARTSPPDARTSPRPLETSLPHAQGPFRLRRR